MATSDKFGGDEEDESASATAQTKARAMRPKYVRRQHREGFGGGGGEELSLWVRVGVVISRLISRAGAPCSLCGRGGRKGGVTVRGSNDGLIAAFRFVVAVDGQKYTVW